jgi:single-strand DNA-binding protein
MNTLKNSVRLIGRLGTDPEIKDISGTRKLAKFSLATSDSYKNDKGEKITETQWHNLIAWGKTAEIIGKYVKKGSEIAIEGKLATRNYIDKDGIKRYMTEITINDMLMLGGRREELD